jgi:ribosomal protein S18 acetylase RimI-like enzyme
MTQSVSTPVIGFRWDKSEATARSAAAFAGRVIGSDARYISHGEIQTGLSPDGVRWAEDLAKLYAQDFSELCEERDLLVAQTLAGEVVGMVILAWESSSRRQFAVLEDMAVEPALRSLRIGERLLLEAELRVKERGIDWLFLESGLGNAGAHRFFERHGFETVSHVFAKRLDG